MSSLAPLKYFFNRAIALATTAASWLSAANTALISFAISSCEPAWNGDGTMLGVVF